MPEYVQLSVHADLTVLHAAVSSERCEDTSKGGRLIITPRSMLIPMSTEMAYMRLYVVQPDVSIVSPVLGAPPPLKHTELTCGTA